MSTAARIASAGLGILGAGGALACAGAMVLAAVGLAGVGVAGVAASAGMASMGAESTKAVSTSPATSMPRAATNGQPTVAAVTSTTSAPMPGMAPQTSMESSSAAASASMSGMALQTTTVSAATAASTPVVGVSTQAATASAGAAAQTSRVGMSPRTKAAAGWPGRILAFLLQQGRAIFLISTGALVLSLASRRAAAVVPALLAGAILYWGMYGQERLSVMYGAMVAGMLMWVVLYLWAYRVVRWSRSVVP